MAGKKEKSQELQTTAPTRALSPFEEMDRLYERLFPRGWLRPSRWEWPAWGEGAVPFEGRMPRVDVIDQDEEVLVRAELPGVDKKDLDILMTDNTVTLKGQTGTEEKEKKATTTDMKSRGALFLAR